MAATAFERLRNGLMFWFEQGSRPRQVSVRPDFWDAVRNSEPVDGIKYIEAIADPPAGWLFTFAGLPVSFHQKTVMFEIVI